MALKGELKYFTVKYNPDLVEGKGYTSEGIVVVNATDKHLGFAEHWCYKEFGNKIAFVMDAYNSSSLTSAWCIKETFNWDLYTNEILARIEEDEVEKLWE